MYQFKDSIAQVYYDAAVETDLRPRYYSIEGLHDSFKESFSKFQGKSYQYGKNECPMISEREWWLNVVHESFNLSASKSLGRSFQYDRNEIHRCFRRIYQHYSTAAAFEVYNDTFAALEKLSHSDMIKCMGVITNSPCHTIETAIPVLGFQKYFKWYVSCMDVSEGKPQKYIFQRAYDEILHYHNGIEKYEVLHIGNDIIEDYEGARSFGFQSLLLNRTNSHNSKNSIDSISSLHELANILK